MAARGRPDPDAINRVKTHYTRAVQKDIEHNVLTREQGEEILARIESLILALTSTFGQDDVGPPLPEGYVTRKQAQQKGGGRMSRAIPG